MKSSHWKIKTYETKSGRKPVDDWIRDKGNVPSKDKARIFRALKAYVVPHGVNLGRPHGAPLRRGLHEMRIRSADGRRHYRIIYFQESVEKRTVIVVLGIIKKTRAISKNDIDLALARKNDWGLRNPRD